MVVSTFDFETGPSTVTDIGSLSYNGCVFSPLFETSVSGRPVPDAAGRTIKYMEYTITVDGYVTLPDTDTSIDRVMSVLRERLTAQGGVLVYEGRGLEIRTRLHKGEAATERSTDLAWGPVPKLMEFQPLGGGRSAKVRWQVTTCIAEVKPGQGVGLDKLMLQFNYDTSVTYDEDGFSTLSVRGTLEIPLWRNPFQSTRTLTRTADDLRQVVEDRILSSIDLTGFRITRRVFTVSRDKRTLEWDVQAEEKPYMDPPPDCTVARGTFSFRPAQAGMGLCLWLCTLRATYTVRADRPRRVAWLAFLALLRHRMSWSNAGNVPKVNAGNQNAPRGPARAAARVIAGAARGGPAAGLRGVIGAAAGGNAGPLARAIGGAAGGVRGQIREDNKPVDNSRKAWLIDFSGDEGMYLDSKTVTFSATWRLVTTFSHILLATGLWSKVPELDANHRNLWALSMRDVSGAVSWLPNKVNPELDLIVDFGA